MSLDAWIASHDEAALAALASPGLLRRAKAAKLGSLRREGGTAAAEVDGRQVEIGPKGAAAARCSCPATGICLHVLALALALRAAAAEAPGGSHSTAASAAEEILALSEAELAAFAGPDWGAALRLAGAGAPVVEASGEGSARARPPDLAEFVTFPVGAGLRGALWKGPAGRRRLAVSAAALALRISRGLVPEARPEETSVSPQDPPLLAAIAEALEATLPGLLDGEAAAAVERLSDLAVSARVQGVLRPASGLRRLVEIARRRAAGDPEARTFDLLVAAARLRALVAALGRRPGDLRLRGGRRVPPPGPPMEPRFLGARIWRSDSGARGMTLYGHDAASGLWVSTHQGRAGDLDPGFSGWTAFRTALFGASSPAVLLGRRLRLEAPRLSEEGVLAPEPGELREGLGSDPLPAFADWRAARADLAARLGSPLTRGEARAPLLLRPTRIGPIEHDPARGGSRIWVEDAQGLRLSLSVAQPWGAEPALQREKMPLLLTEGWEARQRPELALISTILEGPPAQVFMATRDDDDLARFRAPASPPPFVAPPPDSLRDLAADLLDAAGGLARGRPPDPALADRARSMDLEAAARLLAEPPSSALALRLAWLAAEWDWRVAAEATPEA